MLKLPCGCPSLDVHAARTAQVALTALGTRDGLALIGRKAGGEEREALIGGAVTSFAVLGLLMPMFTPEERALVVLHANEASRAAGGVGLSTPDAPGEVPNARA